MAAEVKVETRDGVALVTLDDPATLNACSLEVGRALHDAVRQVEADEVIRCMVLTGAGRAFCSGANLSSSPAREGETKSVDMGLGLERTYNPLMTALRDLRVPLVTAVNGAAAGIGCSLALIGDIIVAAESAYFLQAFRRIGLVPDGGATFMLPRAIGRARAMEMTLLGERIPAAIALDWGLVNRVVPDGELMTTAMEVARKLADGPASLGATRRLVWAGEAAAWDAQLAAEREAQRVAGATSDFVEGVQAFFQKRPAQFTGR